MLRTLLRDTPAGLLAIGIGYLGGPLAMALAGLLWLYVLVMED